MAFTFTKNNIINDVIIIDTQSFWDQRWLFMETYNQKDFENNWIKTIFVQDNLSRSCRGVFRWFHFQIQHIQAKLVRVNRWAVLDFVIDIRKKSPTYGKYIYELLSAENKKQLFIPKWFAHWFLVLEDNTEFVYKCDDYYDPQNEAWITYTDRDINIDRKKIMQENNIQELILAEKDKKHPTLQEFYENNPF